MKEELKYYTPEIEEFHVGFEYQIRFSDHGNWGPWIDMFSKSTHEIWTRCPEYTSKKVQHRVKYLDEDDITNLGFERGEDKVPYAGTYMVLKNATIEKPTREEIMDVHLVYVPLTKWVLVWQVMKLNIGDQDHVRFSGILKNKSELKRLLKQIGVKL